MVINSTRQNLFNSVCKHERLQIRRDGVNIELFKTLNRNSDRRDNYSHLATLRRRPAHPALWGRRAKLPFSIAILGFRCLPGPVLVGRSGRQTKPGASDCAARVPGPAPMPTLYEGRQWGEARRCCLRFWPASTAMAAGLIEFLVVFSISQWDFSVIRLLTLHYLVPKWPRSSKRRRITL